MIHFHQNSRSVTRVENKTEHFDRSVHTSPLITGQIKLKAQAKKTPTRKGKGEKKSVAEKSVAENGDSVPTAAVATPTVEVVENQPAVEAAREVVEKTAYTGPLPTHNGRPMALSREAYAFYLNPQAYGDRHERIRNYLMIQDTFRIAEAIGRPLEVGDLRTLVHPDGPTVKCAATGREFQPMSWTLITPRLIEKIRESKKTLEEIDRDGGLVRVGHFFFRKGKVLAYSGTPYRWRKESETDQVCWHSPVTMAYKANGHRWPITFSFAMELQGGYMDKKRELVSVGEAIASQIGDWRPAKSGPHHQRVRA